MKKIITTLSLIMFCAPVCLFFTMSNGRLCLAQDNAQKAEEYSQLADEASMKGDYNKALEYLDEAIRLNPLPEYYGSRGDLLKTQYRLDEAIQAYKTAILIYPDYFNTYMKLANLYLDRGDPDSAIEVARSALQTTDSELGYGAKMQISGVLAVAYFQKAEITGDDRYRARANMYEVYQSRYEHLALSNEELENALEEKTEKEDDYSGILSSVNFGLLVLLILFFILLWRRVNKFGRSLRDN